MAVRRVEWIGVRTPLDDPQVSYRRLMGLYTPDEDILLEAVTNLVTPLVRQYLSTIRIKDQRDGYERPYQWGPRWFVCEMTIKDAERLFREDEDEYQFRDVDYDGHADRKPVVPWPYINSQLHRIMQEAENGPKVVEVSRRLLTNSAQMDAELKQYQQDRVDKAREYGKVVDPRTNRLVVG